MRDEIFGSADFEHMDEAFADVCERIQGIFAKKNRLYFGAFFKSDNANEAFEDVKRKFMRAKSILDNTSELSGENRSELAELMLDLATYSIMVRIFVGAEEIWRPSHV